MERHHPEMIQAGDEEAVLDIGRRPQRQIPATDCPCCSHEWIDRLKERTFFDPTSDSILTVSPQVFKRHLASHLEQLALFAIPIGSGSYEEINSNMAIEEKTGSRTGETNISALTFHNSKSPSDATDKVHRSIVEGSIDRDGEWHHDLLAERPLTGGPTAESIEPILSKTLSEIISTENSEDQSVTLHFTQKIFDVIQNTLLDKVDNIVKELNVEVQFSPAAVPTESHLVQEAHITKGVYADRIQARNELLRLYEYVHAGGSLQDLANEEQRVLTDQEKGQIPLRLSRDFLACLQMSAGDRVLRRILTDNNIQNVILTDANIQNYHERVQKRFKTTLQVYDISWELNQFVYQEDALKWRCMVPNCRKLFREEFFWHKHIENRHVQWFEDLSKRHHTESEKYLLGHIECPVIYTSEVYSHYKQLLKQISDYANDRADPQDSPCSPTGSSIIHPFIVRAIRSFYSEFVAGDLEFPSGKLVIVYGRAEHHVNTPDTRKLSHWYYGRSVDESGSLESVAGVFPRNFVEWQKDMVLGPNLKVVIQPREDTSPLLKPMPTLKKQWIENNRITLAEESFDPPDLLDTKNTESAVSQAETMEMSRALNLS
jgi:hypothetical protein